MTDAVTNIIVEALPQFEGYVYPNEASLHPVWSTLIVIYPYITGLVAGAFIMASCSMSRRWPRCIGSQC